MADPRKPMYRITDPTIGQLLIEDARGHLIEATKAGCKDIGCSAVSFVLLGIRVWWDELQEVDPYATRRLFQAYADLANPGLSHKRKLKAEDERRAAVDALCHKAALLNAAGEGTA